EISLQIEEIAVLWVPAIARRDGVEAGPGRPRLLLRLPVLADHPRGQTVAGLAAIAGITELQGMVLREPRRQLGQPGLRLELRVQHLLAGAIVHDTVVFVVIFPIGCAVGIADAVGAPLLPALVDRIGGRPMLAGMVVALLAA